MYNSDDPCDAWPAGAEPFSKLAASLTVGNEIDIEGIIESVSTRSVNGGWVTYCLRLPELPKREHLCRLILAHGDPRPRWSVGRPW